MGVGDNIVIRHIIPRLWGILNTETAHITSAQLHKLHKGNRKYNLCMHSKTSCYVVVKKNNIVQIYY